MVEWEGVVGGGDESECESRVVEWEGGLSICFQSSAVHLV